MRWSERGRHFHMRLPLLLVWIDDATVPDDSLPALFTALTGHAVPGQRHLETGTTIINESDALGSAGCAGGLADSMPASPHRSTPSAAESLSLLLLPDSKLSVRTKTAAVFSR